MKQKTKFTVLSALIAALYVLLTLLSSALGLAYGPVQFRVSEALIAFSAFTPAAVPGLTIGCFLSNIGSPYGVADQIIGTIATFLATVSCYFFAMRFKKAAPFIFPFFTALFNGILIGAEITFFTPAGTKFFVFLISACEVALGELAVCFVLGVPLYYLIKNKFKANSLL